MLSVQKFLEGFLTKWETAKHSVDPDDSGNYYKGTLVGSKYGVTGEALAKHRGVSKVSKDDVAGVTLAEAAQIARVTYYDEANFDMLPWGPVVASAVDKCYMSGESAAVKCLQRAAGTPDDGVIGKATVLAVATASQDQEAFAARFASERKAHEARVIAAKPIKAKYRKGWDNRTNSYLPGTSWWKSWELDAQPSALETLVLDKAQEAASVIIAPAVTGVTEASKAVTETADTITTVVVEPKSTATAVKHAISGWQGNLAGTVAIAGALLLDPSFSKALGNFTTALASGNGRFGAIVALIGAGLVAYKAKSVLK